MDESLSELDGQERMSQNGQMIGIAVYGGLLLVGFFFGIVTGYESPKPVVVAKRDKDKDKDTTKPISTTITTPKKDPPQEFNPPSDPPKKDEPKKDPPKLETPPKKDEPKKDPPKVETPPKKDPPKIDTPPKKEEPISTKVVSFEKDVKPIFRSYCFNCHGAAGKPKGDVDLTSLAKIVDPKNPPILKVGMPEKSAIYSQIIDQAMPPNGARPSKGEAEVIRNWILSGAKP
jgi:outer membrane biosynthesis protein TonB